MADDAPTTRGSLGFQITETGDLQNTATNVRLLRQLWADRTLITGDDLGPGDPGDFDYGAWHSSCHLLGAGGARRAADGRVLWLEVSHVRTRDEYFASVTVREAAGVRTVPLDSADGRVLLDGSTVLGFVEGNSTGRTSARQVFDPPDRFNLWRRQDFDQPVTSPLEGGKVWEHWCTLRDLRATNRLGLSVITAYVSLVAALGDQFPAAVARGRREYGHPQQLSRRRSRRVRRGCAAAGWSATPTAIPAALEPLFLEAEPDQALPPPSSSTGRKCPSISCSAAGSSPGARPESVKADLKAFAATHAPGQPPAGGP